MISVRCKIKSNTKRFCGSSGSYPKSSFTLAEIARPSASPANFLEATPITLPMSFPLVAPVSAIISFSAASSSSAVICFGRNFSAAIPIGGIVAGKIHLGNLPCIAFGHTDGLSKHYLYLFSDCQHILDASGITWSGWSTESSLQPGCL